MINQEELKKIKPIVALRNYKIEIAQIKAPLVHRLLYMKLFQKQEFISKIKV
jgi:hypothetical protein